jgi:DNA-binding HxlR family transcriptional regulator
MDTIKVPSASQCSKKIKDFFEKTSSTSIKVCPVRDILHTLSDKWSIMVMLSLGHHKVMRFNELKTNIAGISQKMLTVTVRTLEQHGLIERKVYAQIPPKVEYTITGLGQEFLQHLVVMLDWACLNMETISRIKKKKMRDEMKNNAA